MCTENELKQISKQVAEEKLVASKMLLEQKFYKDSIGRKNVLTAIWITSKKKLQTTDFLSFQKKTVKFQKTLNSQAKLAKKFFR